MWFKRPALQFRMVLNADEPGMVSIFNCFRQHAIRRQPGKNQPALFKLGALAAIYLETVTVAFRDFGRTINLGNV